jgi:lipoyl synthase
VVRSALPILQDENGQPAGVLDRGKPSWLKIKAPSGEHYEALKQRARRLTLATVCEEARCPNIGECWSIGTGTFMLMGDTCTRGCRFCAIKTAKRPPALDPDEPQKIAEAVVEMGLSYVVLTSVDRDDVEDGGAAHLADCLRAIKAESPDVLLEMLIPDFTGNRDALRKVAEAPIAVMAHNLETVRRLTPTVRDPRADYDQSLDVLRWTKELAPGLLTKTSLMLGLGETEDEVVEAMKDCRDNDVDIITFGQYLRPSKKHLAVVEYIHPNTFDRYADIAKELGFGYVASGPLVRSSYRAGELFIEKTLRARGAPTPVRARA